MFTTTIHEDRIAALRAELEAAEAARQAEEAAQQAAIDNAKRHAADAHVRLTLALYERLGVAPEHPGSRITRGRTVAVTTDRSEILRTERLYRIIDALAAAQPELLEQLRNEDEIGRDERRPVPKDSTRAAKLDTIPEADGCTDDALVLVDDNVTA